MTSRAQLRVQFAGTISYVETTFREDGSAVLYLYAVMAARKDVTGEIDIDPQGKIASNGVRDSFDGKALTPYVTGVVERRAREFLAQARRHLRRISDAHQAQEEA